MKVFDTWERVLVCLILLVYLIFGFLIPSFVSPFAIADSSYNFTEKGMVALAMTLLIIAGEIDLSVAATMALSSLAMGLAMQAGAGLWLMLLAALATGLLCGLLNGWLVTRWKLPSIVVTIGTLSLFRGLAQVTLGDQAITGYPETLVNWGNGTVGDMLGWPEFIAPLELPVLLLLALVTGLVLHRTVHGRRIYAIGSNAVAARFSGIAVDRYRMALFVFAGLMAAVAAVLLTGRIGSTRPNLATGWELDVITMVILGGVSISGGKGTLLGTMLAAVLTGVFTFALGMLNVSGIVMTMIMGLLLILSMVLPGWIQRWQHKPAKTVSPSGQSSAT